MSKTFYVATKDTIKDGGLVSYTLASEEDEGRAMEICDKRVRGEYTGTIRTISKVEVSDNEYDYACELYGDNFDKMVEMCCATGEWDVVWMACGNESLACVVYSYTEIVDGEESQHMIGYDGDTDGMTVAEFLVWYIEDGDEGENIEFLDDNSVKFVRGGKEVIWKGEKIDLNDLYSNLYNELKESAKKLSVQA